jgi:hypothetical protein
MDNYSDNFDTFSHIPLLVPRTKFRLLNFIGISVFSQGSTLNFLKKEIIPTLLCNIPNLIPAIHNYN